MYDSRVLRDLNYYSKHRRRPVWFKITLVYTSSITHANMY